MIDLPQFDLFGIALAISLGVNILFWVPAAVFQTEKFYDAVGSLTFITLTLFSLLSRDVRTRQIIVSCLVLAWTLRLGLFLIYRVLKAGHDKRFDEVKKQPGRFLIFWAIQGVWVWTTLLSVLILNFQEPDHEDRSFYWVDIVGWIIYAFGLIFETTSDLQKLFWRNKPENKGKWIDVGLWRYSRHPNYFGELCVWLGIFVACAANFEGVEFVGVISPVFVLYLLFRVSGVPLLEKSADEKWGDNHDYLVYKANTSIFVPLPYGCCARGVGAVEKEEKLNKKADAAADGSDVKPEVSEQNDEN